MLCSKCMQRPVNVVYHQNFNGVVEEYMLCDTCAKELGILEKMSVPFSPLNINDFFISFLGQSISTSALICEQCGMSFDEFSKNGKFGCANCYNVFDDALPSIMKRVQNNTRHIISEPFLPTPSADTITVLQNQLYQALAEENYEQAAIIRDKINEIKSIGDET